MMWFWIIVVPLVLLRIINRLTCGYYHGSERLDGKTVIVTGSNSGIGYESAEDFARRGARVLMACRDMKKAEAAKSRIVSATGNSNIIVKQIDFLSLASVRRCANEILAEEPKIDILLNNAGAFRLKFEQTEDGLDQLMQVNHLGPFLFTNILLGRLKESAPSRIVNVSSIVYLIARLSWDYIKVANPSMSYTTHYGNTKIANIYFSNELASKLKGTGVTSNSLHPGAISTEVFRRASSLFQISFHYIAKYFWKSIKEGAQTSIYLCVSPEVENISGKYFQDCREAKQYNNADNMGIAKKLWEISEDAVKLQPCEKHY